MKKEEKTELTKAKIFEAAMKEFGRKGYAAGSINNICKTGINKGLILKVLFWLATLLIAFLAGKVVSKLKLPAILGWLIAGMILGAGLYTFIYIAARDVGKYFGARFGAKWMKMPETVQKYLGFTLFPHSGVSFVFTGIICATLEGGGEAELAIIVKGNISVAAVINEIIAAILAKKG